MLLLDPVQILLARNLRVLSSGRYLGRRMASRTLDHAARYVINSERFAVR